MGRTARCAALVWLGLTIVIFVTEMLMGDGGLGDAMMLAQRFADSEGVFVGIVAVSVLGYAAMQCVSWMRSSCCTGTLKLRSAICSC